MFEKGEIVYYGTAGVCEVSDVSRSPFDKNDDRIYYVLSPRDFDNGTVIYAPADNSQVVIRHLISAENAEMLISSIGDLPVIEVENEKHRREEYRAALKSGDPQSLARIIKTVYLRKKIALSSRKKISDVDSEFDKIARKALLGELSAALEKETAEIENRVNEALSE
jgi:RNA polymerase-interacting CarD/CdnL/TRCF family regulator